MTQYRTPDYRPFWMKGEFAYYYVLDVYADGKRTISGEYSRSWTGIDIWGMVAKLVPWNCK